MFAFFNCVREKLLAVISEQMGLRCLSEDKEKIQKKLLPTGMIANHSYISSVELIARL